MTPILFKSKTCKFCTDVKTFAGFANIELDEKYIENENPHNLRSVPAIEFDGQVHIGLDDCMAFIRRHAKRAA
jgi:glutaredoxin